VSDACQQQKAAFYLIRMKRCLCFKMEQLP